MRLVGLEAVRGSAPRAFSWLLLSAALALGFGASAQAQVVSGSVVQTIDTSTWTPPSPDPSGISYRPDTGEFLTCDAEVEETVAGITLYQGVNVWTHTSTGQVLAGVTTVPWSREPTGISVDPAGGRLWISDDVRGSIYELDLGADGIFGTADDSRQRNRGYADAGCEDLEDVTYDNFDGHLYVSGGGSQPEICRIGVGENAVFDGAPPFGDDTLVTMSVAAFGITDPEGIVYDPFWNTLVLADRGTRDLYEVTPDGTFLRKIDVNFPSSIKPSGVTIAPGTTNPALRNYFVSDRHVDNDGEPTENDGRIFEVVAIPLGGNGAPIVDAGPPQTVQWPTSNVELDGFVSDDGHPYPPSSVAVLWSKQSGPGSVTFGNPNSATTTASFSEPGSYVLQLVGNDSALASLDSVAITLSANVTLGVSSVGPGSVLLDPPGGSYALGQSVNLTALPDPNAVFVGWSGDLGATTNPETLVMSESKSVTASFAMLHTLTVETTGAGSVTLSPPGGAYPSGTLVTLSAAPGPNAVFDGWGGALAGNTNPETLLIDGDRTVTASFTQLFSVSASAVGPGSVSLSPPTGPYPSGSTVTVSAAPDADAVFVGWSDDLTGTTNPESLLVDGDKNLTASFAALYDVSTSVTGPGMLTLDPPGGSYPAGTVVSVSATPDEDAVFGGFGGDLSGTDSPQLLTVDGDKSVSASFAALYDVSTSVTGPGTLTLDPPGGSYPAGTVVSVSATPDEGAVFGGFGGDLSGTDSPQLLTVDGDKTVSASFAALYDVSTSVTGPGTLTLDPPGGSYPAGTVVSVSATPDEGAVFGGFGGDLSGTDSPQLLTVDGDKTVSASFGPASYTLSVTSSGSGTVTLDPPGGVYEAGTTVTLRAAPAKGFFFGGWSGDASGSGTQLLFVMDADASIHAQFNAVSSAGACGVGPELVALLPPLGWLLRRRRNLRSPT